MSNRFFRPYIGNKYFEGINGKRLLIIGASFNCNLIGCSNWSKCTDETLMDSSEFDRMCPEYQKREDENSKLLSNMPSNEIESFIEEDDYYRSYCQFTHLMCEYLNNKTINVENWNRLTFWEHVAFTNYVQFVLPYTLTKTKNVNAPQNIGALLETLKDLRPNILCVWGTKINKVIQKKLECKMIKIGDNIDTYGFFKYENHDVYYFNPYHPSCSFFSKNKEFYFKIIDTIFNQNN